MTIISHGSAAVILYTVVKKIKTKTFPEPKEIALIFLAGVLPDLPLFAIFVTGNFDPQIHHHHRWIFHTPFFWLISSLLVGFFNKKFALWLLAATFLHLGMDWYGAGDGISYFYPISDKQFGAFLFGVHGESWLKLYLGNLFFLGLELSVIGSFLYILIKSFKSRKTLKN